MSDLWLVYGPPGTGKTSYLARQAERAAEAHGAGQVVITSMTRTAAHEIASRTPDIPEDHVGTLHAHAYRALDRPDLAETPEAIREWNTEHPALELTAGPSLDDGLDETSGKTGGDLLHATCMNNRARQVPGDQWGPEERDYWQLWSDFKRHTNRLDFTDLIEQALYDVDRHPSAPEVFLLDEAQDFSRLELALATSWARHTDSTVIVGDPDQTLYTWRGSDHDALEQLPVTGTRVLEQSYRVPAAVHELAVGWIRQVAGRRDVTYHPTDQPGEARRLPVSLREPGQLLDQVDEDLAAGRSVMVLTTCGYMLAPVLHELRDQGTPFHNPYRPTQGAWNPLRGAARLAAFLRPDDRVWGEKARMWTWGDLRAWTEPLQAAGTLTRGAKALIDEKCRPDRFGESQAEKVAPTETVIELLGDDGTMSHPALRLDTAWWGGRLRASKARTMAYPLEVCRRQGGQALIAKPRVTIGTIHSVKGGEADSVYVFPDLSKQGMWNGWHPGGPTRDQITRMIYVALTRARQRVTVCDPAVPEHVPLDLLTPATEAIAA